VLIVGVSDGGNVAIQAAAILGEMGYKVNVITYNTPAENEDGHIENPAENKGINSHFSFYTEGDKVVTLLGGADRKYTDKPTTHKRRTFKLNNDKSNPSKHATENIPTEAIDEMVKDNDVQQPEVTSDDQVPSKWSTSPEN
jgi:hypothetical protein